MTLTDLCRILSTFERRAGAGKTTLSKVPLRLIKFEHRYDCLSAL